VKSRTRAARCLKEGDLAGEGAEDFDRPQVAAADLPHEEIEVNT
jgi:hypothetical protein